MKRSSFMVKLLSVFLLCVIVCSSVALFTSCNKQETKTFKTLKDFEGTTVACMQGSVFDDIIDGVIDHVGYRTYLSLAEQIAALEKGDVHAIALDMPVAELLVAQHPEFVIFPENVAPTNTG